MFRRPSVRYGKTPEPETPYQRAGQVWNERIGSARVQAANWRLAFFGALALNGGLAAGLVWQSARSTITPWVVQSTSSARRRRWRLRPPIIGRPTPRSPGTSRASSPKSEASRPTRSCCARTGSRLAEDGVDDFAAGDGALDGSEELDEFLGARPRRREPSGLIKALGRADLLILDYFGLEPLDPGARHDLLEILEEHSGRRSRRRHPRPPSPQRSSHRADRRKPAPHPGKHPKTA